MRKALQRTTADANAYGDCRLLVGLASFFKPLHQTIESVNDTFKGQLDLERHGDHTPLG